MRKGVSTTIITILVMLITVSLILISYNWLLKYSPQTQWELEKGLTKEEGCLKIENIDAINGKITIRNCGSVELSDFNVYLDSEKVKSDNSVLRPGGITQIELSMSDGDHEISISSDNAISSPVLINVFSFYCTGTQPPKFGDWIINDDTYCYCLSGRNITLTGNLRVSGSGSITIDNCILWLNQTNQDGYQYQFTFDDTSRTTITNSILNSSKYFHPYWKMNSVNYFENVIFDKPHSGSYFGDNSINTFVNTEFIRQVNFFGSSKSTIKNSRVTKVDAGDYDNLIVIGGSSPELDFENSATIDWRVESTNGIIKGTYITTGSVSGWPISNKVTRYFPTIVKYLDGSPVTGTANITNKTGNLVWQGNIVNGYVEPVITFNNTTYGSGNFTLYVTDGLRTNSMDVNFLTNTSISLILSYCDYYIFSSSDTYTINQNNKVYCLAENININNKNAINFNPGVQNTTLDCQGYRINGSQTVNTNGVTLSGVTTMYDKVTNCIITNFYRGIYIYAISSPDIKYITISNSIINNNTEGMYTYNSENITFINNTVSNNSVGLYLYLTAAWGTYINNTINNNYVGLKMNSFTGNNITGGSVSDNSGWDYYLDFVQMYNYFTNTNFTDSRKIYFNNTPSWFNYNNETNGNIFLYTGISPIAQQPIILTRKLINWNNTLIQWDDTSDRLTTAKYNVTGLLTNTNYTVYDNGGSISGSPFNSSSAGKINFTISLPAGQQHIIKVEKPTFNGVLWFKFNEGNGTNVFDSSSYQNNATYYGETFNDATYYGETFNEGTLGNGNCDPGSGNCPSRVNGYYGKGFQFDGSNDYIQVPDSSTLDIPRSLTLEAWVKWNGPTNYHQGIIAKREGCADAGNYGLYIQNDTNKVQFEFNNGTGSWQGWKTFVSNTAITPNIWTHIVAVLDTQLQTVKIYLNGVQDYSASTNQVPTMDNQKVMIGMNGGCSNQYFNGIIDEVRIYNRSLNQTEVQADMQSSVPMIRTVASWKFEESNSARYINDTHVRVNGTYGVATSFDGENDYVYVSDNGKFDNIPQITVMAWFKLNQLASVKDESEVLITKKHSTSPYSSYYVQQNTDNTLYCVIRNSTGTGVSTQTAPVQTLNKWYHIACVYNGTHVKIYLNGTPGAYIPESPLTGYIYNSDQPFRIGADWSGGGRTNGTIDEVRVYNRSLTQAEIQAEMQSSMPMSRSIASYKFEEVDSGKYANDTHIWVNGTYGYALSFDGIDDYVNITTNENLLENLPEGSICLWFNWAGGIWQGLVGDRWSTNDINWTQIWIGNNQILFAIKNDTEYTLSGNTLSTNQWYFYCGTWNSSGLYLYGNGNLEDSRIDYKIGSLSNNFYALVGRYYTTSSNFNGTIDEIRIWNRVLSQAEIQAEKNKG